MSDIIEELIQKWDISVLKDEKHKKFSYNDIYDTIKQLKDFKFTPYQPEEQYIINFFDKLEKWLQNFADEKKKRVLIYLCSKIIFFTQKEIESLMKLQFRNIKKLILENITKERGLDIFSFLDADLFFKEEFEKVAFCQISNSAKIDEFARLNPEISRLNNIAECVEGLIFLMHKYINFIENDKPTAIKYLNMCKDVISDENNIRNKKWLVLLEDHSCSGKDYIDILDLIIELQIPIKKIIIAPYIITYKAISSILEWIQKRSNQDYEFFLQYGVIIREDLKCFDTENCYLQNDWFEKTIDVKNEIKEISKETYLNYFTESLLPECMYGYKDLKIAYVNYCNCPDNSLPIIWYPKNPNFYPLFKRSERKT